ncbi:MAG TPA: hypothetical protein VEN82_06510 [Actinomycetota bacterium]|nr:hypothetical protein [Actinomycetota bacterium]
MRQEDVPEALLAACPSFGETRAWHDSWRDYGAEEQTPLYILMSDLVRRAVRQLAEGRTNELPALFSVVERMIDDGDRYVALLAVVGLLEDLQNTNLHLPTTKPSDFEPFFGPHTSWWWEEVRLFWEERVIPLGSSGRRRPPDMQWTARRHRRRRRWSDVGKRAIRDDAWIFGHHAGVARFLCCYDYGMGGVWCYIEAASAERLRELYPELTVVKDPPAWMDALQGDRIAALKQRSRPAGCSSWWRPGSRTSDGVGARHRDVAGPQHTCSRSAEHGL